MTRSQSVKTHPHLSPVHIAVVVTVLNEASNISQVLETVTTQPKDYNAIKQVIVVDGGSKDNTICLAKQLASRSKVPLKVVSSPYKGRAFQFNLGAERAVSCDAFLFLHGDTILPRHYDETIRHTLSKPDTVAGAFSLGFRTSKRKLALQMIAFFANLRSRLFQLPFGDQGLFLLSTTFYKLGGFPRQHFLEDVEIIRRLKRLKQGKIRIAPVKVWTDARRWNSAGTSLHSGIIGGILLHAIKSPTISIHEEYVSVRDQHDRAVSCVKFSCDGSRLASCSADKTVKLWDVSTGKLVQTLCGHTQGISDLSWSRDSRYVATASDDKTVGVWDTHQCQQVAKWTGHKSFVFCVSFNPRCNLLASGSTDETIRIWDVRTGRTLKMIPAHSNVVTAVEFSKDGTVIVSSSYDGSCRFWDTASGMCLKTLVVDSHPATSHVRFSPNSRYILASTLDSKIRLWDFFSSRICKTYAGHVNQFHAIYSCFVVMDPTHCYVVSGSEDKNIYVWDLQSRQVEQQLQGHTSAVISVSAHPKEPLLASSALDPDCSVKVWRLKNDTSI